MMGARDSVLCLGGEVEKSEKLNQSSLFLLAVQYHFLRRLLGHTLRCVREKRFFIVPYCYLILDLLQSHSTILHSSRAAPGGNVK